MKRGNGEAYGLDVPAPQVLMDVRTARPADVSGCDVSDPSTCTVPDPDPQDSRTPSDSVVVGGLETVVVTYAVTNTGQSTLPGYTVTDDQTASSVTPGASLAPGATETATRIYAAPSALGITTFTAQVSAEDAGANSTSDREVYGIDVVRPAVRVNALVGNASAFCSPSTPPIDVADCSISETLADGTPRPDTVQAVPGGDFYLVRYVVTNTGASTVEQVRITNEGQEVVSATGLDLAPGQSTSLKWIGTAPVSPGLVTLLTRAIGVDGAGVESQIRSGTRDLIGVQTQGIAFRLFTQVASASLFCTDPNDPTTCSLRQLNRMKANPKLAKAALAKASSDREVVRYLFFNTGTVPFVNHTLTDNVAGTVFSDRSESIGGLDSLEVYKIYDEVPLIGESRSATWTSQAESGEVLAQTSTEAPLPVELAGFDAEVAGRGMTLRWVTASEENNAGFEIQRFDPETETWVAETFVEGAGTSAETKHYRYDAGELEPDVYRFRLRQIDLDGRFAVSKDVAATVAIDGAYRFTKLYPHPVRREGTFSLTARETQQVRVEVYDVLGRRVATLFDGELDGGRKRDLHVRTDRLSSGVYFLRAVGERFTATQRITVVR